MPIESNSKLDGQRRLDLYPVKLPRSIVGSLVEFRKGRIKEKEVTKKEVIDRAELNEAQLDQAQSKLMAFDCSG